jgi:cathepsin A (carboxypeptidase C)
MQGNEAWVEKLEHKFHEEFVKSVPTKWTTLESGRVAGEVRSAGGNGFTAGNVTFVQVFEAGHMVPYDQPEAALASVVVIRFCDTLRVLTLPP